MGIIGPGKKKLKCLCWLSILLFLCGVAIIVSSIIVDQGAGWKFGDEVTPPEFKMTKNIGLGLLWVSGVICFCIGFLGCCVTKMEKKCLIMLYGSGLGFISSIVFIIGCIFAFQAVYMPTAVATACMEKNTAQQQPFMKRSYLDTNMLFQVNRWMCTSSCPCDANAYTGGYANVPESNFTYHGRTSQPGTRGKLAITTVQSGGMTSFEQCWNNSRKAQTTDANLVKSMDSYLQVMRLLEPQYACSGACIPAFFWFTQPITSKPINGCLNSVTSELIKTYVLPGWICIVASLIMTFIFIFQYTLWCQKSTPIQHQGLASESGFEETQFDN